MLIPVNSDRAASEPVYSAQQTELANRNQSDKPYRQDVWVPQYIAEHAQQNPHSLAVVGESMQLTYAELDRRANQIAHYLRSFGIGPDVRVGICLHRSPLNVVAALAVLKAGGAYVPLDPTYPTERLSFILGDANIPLLLTEHTLANVTPPGLCRRVFLDDAELFATYPTTAPPNSAEPEHLAYVIYTSGSTGTPKGVEITHDSLLNLVFWHQRAFGITAADRATQLASFGFDAAVWEIWPHLVAGASVYVVPEMTRTSAELLRDWLVGNEITISFVPTALAERLITIDWPKEAKLRVLLTGADTLQHYPRPGLPFQLVNNYGPTEATVVATSGLVPPEPLSSARPPIGRPIDNTQIYILDQDMKSVPTGEIGELYIGGAGVARGYTNSKELTAHKFIPDPFSDKPGSRLYRTGDLGRYLPDGQIAFIGRADNLIKIRGYRVEPNEIITVLNTHPAVRASAVIGRDDGAGNVRLLAYIVTDGCARPSSDELRRLLRSHMPDYMIPAAFIALESLPLTPNGKVDRDALPDPTDANTLQEDYVAPRTALEDKVARIVANLLGLERVGVAENFFLLGGHSLLGTQLIARIRDSFGVELPLRSIFDSPTPAQLSSEVERLIIAQVDSMTEDEARAALQQADAGGVA